MRLRPALKQFADNMETVLKHHDNNYHWRHCNEAYLVQRLNEEIGELIGVLLEGREAIVNYEDCVLNECCDIANFAMMIADNFGGMREERRVLKEAKG